MWRRSYPLPSLVARQVSCITAVIRHDGVCISELWGFSGTVSWCLREITSTAAIMCLKHNGAHWHMSIKIHITALWCRCSAGKRGHFFDCPSLYELFWLHWPVLSTVLKHNPKAKWFVGGCKIRTLLVKITEIRERRMHWFVVSEENGIELISNATVASTWTYSSGT